MFSIRLIPEASLMAISVAVAYFMPMTREWHRALLGVIEAKPRVKPGRKVSGIAVRKTFARALFFTAIRNRWSGGQCGGSQN